MDRRQSPARAAIDFAWGLLQVIIFGGALYGGLLGGAALGFGLLPRLDGGRDIGALLLVGTLGGLAFGFWICHRARWWVQQWRLRRMRETGVTATATVQYFSEHYWANSRGPGATMYNVQLRWTGPDGDQLQDRWFRFNGHGLRAFETALARGTRVTVRYPAGQPNRFIILVPYSATMADQFV